MQRSNTLQLIDASQKVKETQTNTSMGDKLVAESRANFRALEQSTEAYSVAVEKNLSLQPAEDSISAQNSNVYELPTKSRAGKRTAKSKPAWQSNYATSGDK